MFARISVLAVAAATFVFSTPAHAGFTTAVISSYLNGNVTTGIQDDPVGHSYGNTGTGVPFETSAYGKDGYMGSAFLAGQSSPGTSSTLAINLNALDLSGQASFYALLSNYYGTPGANEYSVTINFTNGQSETYNSIGGVDTRDYNENPATSNTIANTTTEWWTNEAMNGPSGYQRLDVREFTINPEYQDNTISSFTITQLDWADPAFLSGLTFSTDPASLSQSVPEPASLALFALGAMGVGVARRRRR